MTTHQDEIDNYLAQILGEDLPAPSVVAQDNGELGTGGGTYLSPEQYYAFAASHGGVVGTFPVDPTVSEQGVDVFGSPVQKKVPNPNPRYKVQFADGTSMTYQTIRMPSADGQQGKEVGVNVTDGGTAMKASTTKPIVPDDLTPTTSARFIPRRMPDGSIQWDENKNYVEPRGPQPPQRAPRYADEEQLAQLEIQKAQRDLQNPYILKQQQMDEAIRNIADQYARNEISIEERDKLMLYVRQNLDAAMRGTTPFQMEQDRLNREQTRRTQQQNLAQNFVADRGQLGGSMATGLLSGLGGIYGKILGGTNPPLDMDPLAMGPAFASQQYGGPELNDMALAILRSALGQGGM